MLEIKKTKSDEGYSFEFFNGKSTFYMMFCGNLDLYWDIYNESMFDSSEDLYFEITKENYFIYSLFEKLYDKIKNCKVFKENDFDVLFYSTEEEKEDSKQRTKELNEGLKDREEYKTLFQDGKIIWKSDDSPFNIASSVTIEKQEKSFKLTFKKSEDDEMFTSFYQVRFRNSGSRYIPFNSVFMEMYNTLVDYEPSIHQIHFEENIYNEK